MTEDGVDEVARAIRVERFARHEPPIDNRPEKRQGRELGIEMPCKVAGGDPFCNHVDQALSTLGRILVVELTKSWVALCAFDESGNT